MDELLDFIDRWWMNEMVIRWVDTWIDGWMGDYMNTWLDELMDGTVIRRTDGWMNWWMYEWMDKWMDGLMYVQWIDGWFDGSISCLITHNMNSYVFLCLFSTSAYKPFCLIMIMISSSISCFQFRSASINSWLQ